MGSRKQNTGPVHGAALGEADVAYVKAQLGFNPDDKYVVPDEVYRYFKDCRPSGEKLEADWSAMMSRYKEAYPKEAAELNRRLAGKLREGWEASVPRSGTCPRPRSRAGKLVGS